MRRLQIPFDVARPDIDESPSANEKPAETAIRLSVAKARHLATDMPNCLIIGSDQVADLHGTHIGKPGAVAVAREQLRAMRGQELIFHSGLALINSSTGSVQSCVIPTTVRFREFTDAEIERYLEREDALDCAGSAKSEGLGIALIAGMQSDDPTALVGLPLIALAGMLRNEGLAVLE